MNASQDDLPVIDPRLLDLLVDGELSEKERRDLLVRLDKTAGGWRACALAFLEAQCLRESLRHAAPRPAAQVAPPRIARSWGGRWKRVVPTILAMAASLLVAVAVGWWAGGMRHGPGLDGAPGAASPDRLADRSVPPSQPRRSASGPEEPGAGPRVFTVALPPDWSLGGEEVRLPVVERDHVDHSLLFPDAAALPAEFRDVLRRAGYQVEPSRKLLPVRMHDGRQAIVPVDQLQIRYVGNHVE